MHAIDSMKWLQTFTENRESSWCQACRHWWHHKLSWRQHPKPPVTTKSASWQLLDFHYSDAILSAITQRFVQAQIKENIKAPPHWPLWGESTAPLPGAFPAQKGQLRGKCFHDVIIQFLRTASATRILPISVIGLKYKCIYVVHIKNSVNKG